MSVKEAQRPGLIRAARDGKITNREGAAALGLSIRQFRRLRRRYESGGASALAHRARGRPSVHRLSETLRQRVQTLLRGRYAGFNDCHLTEILREQEGLMLSRASVQRIRQDLGIAPKRRRRPPRHRRRREREARRGALVLVDASEHRWCEDRADAFALLGAVDDATGAIVGLVTRPHEDLHGYALLLRDVIQGHGVPAALYGDRTNIFVRNDRHWTLAEELAGEQRPTQGGRILRQLGIGYIAARSPQAKGRIERFWGTLQDRLVSLLRLHGASSREEASRFLPGFIEDFNRRFTMKPRDTAPAWRPAPKDLDRHLSCAHTRVVARDNTVTLGTRWVQIPQGPRGRSYAKRRVEVLEHLDGSLLVRYRGVVLAQQEPAAEFTLRATPRKERPPAKPLDPIRTKAYRVTNPRGTRPGPNHPWRAFVPTPVKETG
jgi:transposase